MLYLNRIKYCKDLFLHVLIVQTVIWKYWEALLSLQYKNLIMWIATTKYGKSEIFLKMIILGSYPSSSKKITWNCKIPLQKNSLFLQFFLIERFFYQIVRQYVTVTSYSWPLPSPAKSVTSTSLIGKYDLKHLLLSIGMPIFFSFVLNCLSQIRFFACE